MKVHTVCVDVCSRRQRCNRINAGFAGEDIRCFYYADIREIKRVKKVATRSRADSCNLLVSELIN